MKMFEILWEVSKCDTKTQSEWTLLGKYANRLAQHRIATNLPFENNKNNHHQNNPMYLMHNKANPNKMKYVCRFLYSPPQLQYRTTSAPQKSLLYYPL